MQMQKIRNNIDVTMGADIFGMAFHDFMEGEEKEVILVHTDITETEELPVAYFFRGYDVMPRWEQLALDTCKGRVLDVGAGAGSHALLLQERGHDITAIDISKGGVDVMKRRGIKNALHQDFFHFAGQGFDTILLLMNGLGMAETLPGLERVFKHAARLLNPGGCILLESTDLMYMFEEEDGSYLLPMQERYYGEISYQLEYRGRKGRPFPWLFADFDNMAEAALRCGFEVELLYSGESHNYLAKLVLPAQRQQ
jgi:SAM-dependent methyltransferase